MSLFNKSASKNRVSKSTKKGVEKLQDKLTADRFVASPKVAKL